MRPVIYNPHLRPTPTTAQSVALLGNLQQLSGGQCNYATTIPASMLLLSESIFVTDTQIQEI